MQGETKTERPITGVPSGRGSAAPAAAMLAALLACALPGPAAAQVTDGAAAADEWQQEVSYLVEGRLDEEAEALRARGELAYRNASPDTLDHLYFHLSLNAFRPNSLWARTEGRERFDFQSLEAPEHAYLRLERIALTEGGEAREGEGADRAALRVTYPHAPDSTVARVELSRPLLPGEEARLRMEWEARPSTLCRRQCREGRHYDFAQWYPRVAVYEPGGWAVRPLLPQGEFYGEFGTYDVTLDLAEDQVIGATGVPVEGDPGWRYGPAGGEGDVDDRREVTLRRDFYGDLPSPSLGFLEEESAEGRRRVRFHAERVHHFAWSVDPDFLYEGGEHEGTAIHVLYRRGALDWDLGAAVRRTIRALAWMEGIFGPYPYPQLTNLHRLESGGTEFPMLIMDGSPSQGLIAHEVAHQFAHALLANNEWREAWLDEGMASFVDTWFFAEHGARDVWSGSLERAAALERAGPALPISTPAADFPDYGTYAALSYTRAAMVLRMLRGLVGEPTFREILATYYERHAFTHVTGEEFRAVAEEVSERDLGWFFEQWFHSTATLDYALGRVSAERQPDGSWRTRVEVRREGEAWMPVDVRVGERTRTLRSRERSQVVEVMTRERPDLVEIDPDRILLESDRTNDRREL